MMTEAKEQIASAIFRARAELEAAVCELENLPSVSKSSISFSAHALNNFITVTGGAVELLQLSLVDYPDPEVHELLKALQQSTNLMTQTVSQLTNALSVQDARVIFDRLDLSTLAHRFAKFYGRIAERKQIRCLFEPSDDNALVWTDKVMTAAILDNLLSNAVKYSSHGTCVWINVSGNGDGIVCSVRDEGPGLSQEDQAKLFQRGAQGSSKPTGGEPSTGYGLAVAKEFVERLGGSIWCESAMGEGACFSFELPCYQEDAHGPLKPDA
jgi:signal transduction histidine kinase